MHGGVATGCYAFKRDGTCVHAFVARVFYITIIIEQPQIKTFIDGGAVCGGSRFRKHKNVVCRCVVGLHWAVSYSLGLNQKPVRRSVS